MCKPNGSAQLGKADDVDLIVKDILATMAGENEEAADLAALQLVALLVAPEDVLPPTRRRLLFPTQTHGAFSMN